MNNMSYSERTQELMTDLVENPCLFEGLAKNFPSRFDAMRFMVSREAETYVHDGNYLRPGQIAQRLSDWHSELAIECSDRFRHLTTDPEGPKMSKDMANQDHGLLVIQCLRRGIKDARKQRYSFAQKQSNPRTLDRVYTQVA